MKVRVDSHLYCGTSSSIEIPVESWDEIKNWYVQNDTFHYTTDWKIWKTQKLNSSVENIVDWKEPELVNIYNEKEQTFLDYG